MLRQRQVVVPREEIGNNFVQEIVKLGGVVQHYSPNDGSQTMLVLEQFWEVEGGEGEGEWRGIPVEPTVMPKPKKKSVRANKYSQVMQNFEQMVAPGLAGQQVEALFQPEMLRRLDGFVQVGPGQEEPPDQPEF
jgi:hypothetical protein